MELITVGTAGTLESGDIFIEVDKNDNEGRVIFVKSSVEERYGKQIYKAIVDTLDRFAVDNVTVNAIDKGALDCTIYARMTTALHRAANTIHSDWGK